MAVVVSSRCLAVAVEKGRFDWRLMEVFHKKIWRKVLGGIKLIAIDRGFCLNKQTC